MSLLATYLAAEFPAQRRVAGQALQPYTLGHAKLLRALESPYTERDGREPGLGDLALALELCSRPWPAPLAVLRDPKLRRKLQRRVAAWAGWTAKQEVEAHLQMFGYIAHFSTGPQWKTDPRSTGRAGAPLLAQLTVALLQLGYTPERADATPLNQAFWLASTHWELAGSLTITAGSNREDVLELFATHLPGMRPATREDFQGTRQESGISLIRVHLCPSVVEMNYA